MPMFYFFVLFQLLCVSIYASVIFEDCGSAYDLEAVNIEGCGMSLPCYITLGDNVPVSVEFFADFTSSQLAQNVIININYINLETDVFPDPCEIVDCPVPTDCVTSITSIMSVPKNVALNQRGYLNWQIYNEKAQLVLCYSVLVQTQSPLQKYLRAHLQNLGIEDLSIIDSIKEETVLDKDTVLENILNGLNRASNITQGHNITK